MPRLKSFEEIEVEKEYLLEKKLSDYHEIEIMNDFCRSFAISF